MVKVVAMPAKLSAIADKCSCGGHHLECAAQFLEIFDVLY
jgi:hypothetical protein